MQTYVLFSKSAIANACNVECILKPKYNYLLLFL